MTRKNLVAVVGVELHEQPDLFEVVQALDAIGFRFGLGKRGQKHRRQDGDDRDDDEQFDEREARAKETKGMLLPGQVILIGWHKKLQFVLETAPR